MATDGLSGIWVPTGPEDKRNEGGFVKKFPITVTVYEGDKEIRQEHIDYGIKEHRLWLGRASYYYLNLGYTIETKRRE